MVGFFVASKKCIDFHHAITQGRDVAGVGSVLYSSDFCADDGIELCHFRNSSSPTCHSWSKHCAVRAEKCQSWTVAA